eukprot:165158-Pleurochrysis_carterae.AAC.1
MEEGARKQGERDGACGVCARASVATVNARLVGKLTKSSQRLLALTKSWFGHCPPRIPTATLSVT